MRVLVTGSSGLVGSALCDRLVADGHDLLRLRRGDASAADEARWDPERGSVDIAALVGVDAVVHLAGESIGERRWTDEQKRRIRASRVTGTTLLAEALAGLPRPPAVLVSASAIGYYGDRGDEVLTEDRPPGDDFLAGTCVAWEAATAPAAAAGIRTVLVRTGIVLSARGGALARMLLPFKLGLGGRIGRGDQWMSWISLADEVGATAHLLGADAVTGPVNLTAPEPVTNRTFVRTLGSVLGRPTVLPTPLLPLKLRYGAELVESLLLFSQRVDGSRLAASGYACAHPELEAALRYATGRG